MIKDHATYAATFIADFDSCSKAEPRFVSEHDVAVKVVELMRHYDGTGWHGFMNAVRWWLADRGVDLDRSEA